MNKNRNTNMKYIKERNCLHIHIHHQFPRGSPCKQFGKVYKQDRYQSVLNSLYCYKTKKIIKIMALAGYQYNSFNRFGII